jgi:serine/threonine protein phosphatase PrpC
METLPELPPVECAQASDSGRDPEKQVNEDACGYAATRFGHLCVVCDGMGGHTNGREAAQLSLQTILETFARAPSGGDAERGATGRALLREAIARANARVSQLGGPPEAEGRPGSTVVAVLMHADGVEVAHVGDSRCYLIQGGQIFQVTKDHTVVQKMVDAGLLTPEESAVHPDANQILRALGASPEVDVDVRAQTLAPSPSDVYLLCSDGLSDRVTPAELVRIASASPPSQAVLELVDLANARGGHDNITVMILRARREGPSVRPSAPTVAQTLFLAPLHPTREVPGETAALPMAETRAGPRFSLTVGLGVVLAGVGFAAAGFAIFVLVTPGQSEKNVAPFALTASPLVTRHAGEALVPFATETLPALSEAGLDSGTPSTPLPPLAPSRPPHRGHAP